MKKKKLIFIVAAMLLVAGLIGGLVTVKVMTYHPTKTALTYTHSNAQVEVSEIKEGIKFIPKNNEKALAVLFYPGALVEEQSYAIWANQLAAQGYPVYLIHMPLNLAILSGNKAEEVIRQEQLQDYVIGGHSLGGVMASRFAANHPTAQLKGVFFLASYPDEEGSLLKQDYPVLSVTASEDHVLNQENYNKSKELLPQQTIYQTISGGNHGGFGSYGHQKKDGKEQITNDRQQQELVQLLSEWLKTIEK